MRAYVSAFSCLPREVLEKMALGLLEALQEFLLPLEQEQE